MFRLVITCLFALPVIAAPIPVGEFALLNNSVKPWPLAGESACELAPGAVASLSVAVPPLSDNERSVGGEIRGVLSIDLYGTVSDGTGKITLEALDTVSGQVFASGNAEVTQRAQRSPWVVISSSEQNGSDAARAFDGDPKTKWHTKYSDDKAESPHWIGMKYGKPTRMTGLNYLPRQQGSLNGVARKYRVDILRPGKDWETITAGETDLNFRDDRASLEVRFSEAVEADAIRFVIESDWSGGGFGSAAEIELPGVKFDPVPEVIIGSRAWAEIPPNITQSIEGKSFTVRVRNGSDNAVVVGSPRFARVHLAPTAKLFGRSNGGLGPDQLGAGLLGFDALTIHRETFLPVMDVRADTAAARQGLRQGDVILAVRNKILPVNDVSPGWTWFHDSHEAVIGRETEKALAAGENTLPLTLLRDGGTKTIELPLNRKAAFTTMNPASDPEAARMLGDSIAFLVRTQRDDGSWSGCIIRTCFSALALLATEEETNRERVKKAVEWARQRYQKPENYGNLGFWHGAFAGILYSEWHLATGDDSVLPNIEALRDWAIAGQYNSSWNVPALGHGTGGLPYGNKSLVAPSCHLLVFEAIAMRGGMKSGIWELLMPYMEMSWSDPTKGGNGTLGYNPSLKDLNEFWSRTGLFAMAAHLRGERSDMRDSMLRVMHERHPWLRNSHAYGEPGGALGLLALNLVSPDVYDQVIREYAWWFSLAWDPGYGLRYTTPHMGAPYMGDDDLINATYALVLQGPRRNLHITGLPKNIK